MTDLLNTKETAKGSEIVDFAQSLGHTMLESPVNGAVQVLNKATGLQLPELNIIGAPREASLGTMAGAVAGAAVDYFVLAKLGSSALGNLGGNGIAGQALRSGIIGGVYAGILTPSDPNSNSFFGDRIGNAAVGALTFASMSGASAALDKTGMFAVPEVRTLTGYLSTGAASGLAGGIAHAEANAIIKDGNLLPSASNLFSDSLSYTAFGATFGALNWGYNQLNSPVTTHVVNSSLKYKSGDTDPVSVKVQQNAQGQVVKVQADLPSATYRGDRVGWEATKMTDGSWSSPEGSHILDGKWYASEDVLVPKLTKVELGANGSLRLTSSDGDIRTLNPDADYTKVNPERQAADLKFQNEMKAIQEKSLDYVNEKGVRNVTFEYKGANGNNSLGSTRFSMNGDTVTELSFNPKDTLYANVTSMVRTGADTWTVSTNDSNGSPVVYSWKGDVKALAGEGGKIGSVQLKPANAAEVAIDRAPASVADAYKAVLSTAKYEGLNPNWDYVRMDPKGNIFMRTDSGTIFGQPTGKGEVQIKPGDNVNLRYDIGDRGPYWVDVPVQWTKTLDGSLLFNGKPLSPDMVIGLRALTEGISAPY